MCWCIRVSIGRQCEFAQSNLNKGELGLVSLSEMSRDRTEIGNASLNSSNRLQLKRMGDGVEYTYTGTDVTAWGAHVTAPRRTKRTVQLLPPPELPSSEWEKFYKTIFKGGVCDSGERLLTLELNSQTTTLPSVLRQKPPPKKIH